MTLKRISSWCSSNSPSLLIWEAYLKSHLKNCHILCLSWLLTYFSGNVWRIILTLTTAINKLFSFVHSYTCSHDIFEKSFFVCLFSAIVLFLFVLNFIIFDLIKKKIKLNCLVTYLSSFLLRCHWSQIPIYVNLLISDQNYWQDEFILKNTVWKKKKTLQINYKAY